MIVNSIYPNYRTAVKGRPPLNQRKREDGEERFGIAITTYYDSDLGKETLPG